MTIGVLDYGAGNLRSVETALAHLGYQYRLYASPDGLDAADVVIFPGVGEAAAAMANLARTGLDAGLREYLSAGRPVLGICLGSQIVLDRSEERDTPCLGLVPGVARRFSRSEASSAGDDGPLKVPHMGWNSLHYGSVPDPLFAGIPEGTCFYFVHSYFPDPELDGGGSGSSGTRSLATCDYGTRFVAAFRRFGLTAVQFHPEKSGYYGLRLLANFLVQAGMPRSTAPEAGHAE